MDTVILLLYIYILEAEQGCLDSLHMYKHIIIVFHSTACLSSLAGNAKLRPGQTTVCQKRPSASFFSWRHGGSSQFEALSQNITFGFSANSFKAKAKKKKTFSSCSRLHSTVGTNPCGHYLSNGYFFRFESDCRLVLTVWVPSDVKS